MIANECFHDLQSICNYPVKDQMHVAGDIDTHM